MRRVSESGDGYVEILLECHAEALRSISPIGARSFVEYRSGCEVPSPVHEVVQKMIL